jgi:cytochrome oxidase Cu insertion factor (SCO1/SenC/PrrC family)
MDAVSKMQKIITLFLFALLLQSCANYDYTSQVKLGESLIEFEGESLAGEPTSMPQAFAGQNTLLLFGYVHKSQFDIDRWLIGLDQTNTPVAVYEIPTIKGMFPQMFSTVFDNAMREGIPKEIWKGVITVYKDGDKVQKYTGNLKPKNARVLLLDAQGQVIHFYDRGFSVDALNAVREKLNLPE